MKFKKVIECGTAQFRNEKDNLKIVNYGGKIRLFKRIPCDYKGKKFLAFGDSVEYGADNKPKDYKTYRNAMKSANFLEKQGVL